MTWREQIVVRILFLVATIVGGDLEPAVKRELDQIRMTIQNASRS